MVIIQCKYQYVVATQLKGYNIFHKLQINQAKHYIIQSLKYFSKIQLIMQIRKVNDHQELKMCTYQICRIFFFSETYENDVGMSSPLD